MNPSNPFPRRALSRLGSNQFQHCPWIKQILFVSPITIATLAGNSIRLWDLSSKRLLHILEGHSDCVESAAMSLDGSVLATAGRDGLIRLWNIGSGSRIRQIEPMRADLVGLAFVSNDSLLSVQRDGTIEKWDVVTGKRLHKWKCDGKDLKALVCNQSHGITIVGCEDGSLIAFDVRNFRTKWTFTRSPDYLVSLSLLSLEQLVLSCFDGSILVLDISSGQVAHSWQHTSQIKSMATSADGQRLAIGGYEGSISIRDANDGAPLASFNSNFDETVCCLAFSPNSEMLVAGSGSRIDLWSASDWKALTDADYPGSLGDCSLSNDGKLLAWCGSNSMGIWDLADGRLTSQIKMHRTGPRVCAYGPNGETVVVAGLDNTIRLYDLQERTFETIGEHSDLVEDLLFSVDGEFIVACDNDSQGSNVIVRELKTRSEVSRIRSDRFPMHLNELPEDFESVVSAPYSRVWQALRLAISRDGKVLAVGGSAHNPRNSALGSQFVPLYEFPSLTGLGGLDGGSGLVNSLAFSPSLLAAGFSDSTITLFDVNTGRRVQQLNGHTAAVTTLAFSPNGHILASGSKDCTIRLWDVNAGACLDQLSGHTEEIRRVIFHPKENWVISGSFDNTILVWNYSDY